MDTDRFEKLVGQVLEETRAFRQEMSEKFHALDQKVSALDQKVTTEFATVNKKIDMLGGAVIDLRARVEKLEKAAE